jgi:hypothetical protein
MPPKPERQGCAGKVVPASLLANLPLWLPQGAFKRVAQEVDACAKELSGTLRQQLLARPDEAAECILMIAKLGEPTESLQARVCTGRPP